MKLNRQYQTRLMHRRMETNCIAASWSVFYKGEYICGALYSGQLICSVVFPCGLQVFSKSLSRAKAYVRAYKAGRLEA